MNREGSYKTSNSQCVIIHILRKMVIFCTAAPASHISLSSLLDLSFIVYNVKPYSKSLEVVIMQCCFQICLKIYGQEVKKNP